MSTESSYMPEWSTVYAYALGLKFLLHNVSELDQIPAQLSTALDGFIESRRTYESFAEWHSKLASAFLGPVSSIRAQSLPVSRTTKEIIEQINQGPKLVKPDREEELSEKLGKALDMCIEDAGIKSGPDHNQEYTNCILTYATLLVSNDTHEVGPDQIESANKVHHQFLKHLQFLVYFRCGTVSNLSVVLQLREQGNNLMANLAHAQAIQVYTQALDLTDFSTENQVSQLLTNRAIAYIGLNCFPEAIVDLNQAVEFEPSFTPAWTQMGYCHLYMGNSLVALKSYLLALRASVGEILPHGFPADNADLVKKYREDRFKNVLPQFIKRLCQSISLTEKRAFQQAESSAEIRSTVSEVRRILAVLRSQAHESDMEYYTYHPYLRDNLLRSMSERANRSHPNILLPEVAQNILANGGTEAIVATPVDLPGIFGGRNRNDRNETTDERSETNEEPAEREAPSTAAPTAAAPARTSGGIQDILNEFGDLMERRLGGPAPNTNLSTNTQSTAGATGSTGATGSSGASSQAQPGESVLRDVLRGVLPDGVANIISQFTTSHEGTPVYVDYRHIGGTNRDANTNTNTNTNESNGSTNDNEEDENMDVANDLD